MTDKVRWVEPFAYKAGEPFRIMPVGTFKRGARTLTITQQDLQQMADNAGKGIPRWSIPIYAGHPTDTQPDPPKVGNAQKLEVRADGLYAYPEYNDSGTKLISEQAYQYTSPGVLWSKNGSEYTDEQGNTFDNTVDHIALTNRPYFGKTTALFSIEPFQSDYGKHKHSLRSAIGVLKSALQEIISFEAEEQVEGEEEGVGEIAGPKTQQELAPADINLKPKAEPGKPIDMTNSGTYSVQKASNAMAVVGTPTNRVDKFKDYNTEDRKNFAKKGYAMPDGSYPIADAGDLTNAIHAIGRGSAPHANIKAHIVKRAKALGKTDLLPADWEGSTAEKASAAGVPAKEKEKMAEEVKVETAPVAEKTVETFAVSAEEFAALKAQAAKAETLEAKLTDMGKQTEKFAAELAAERRARRIAEISKKVETFSAVPEETVKLAEKFSALEDKDAELFKFFMEKVEQMSNQLVAAQSGLFSQVTSAAKGTKAERFETLIDSILVEKFSGDMAHYSDAMKLASAQRPDLQELYLATRANARGA